MTIRPCWHWLALALTIAIGVGCQAWPYSSIRLVDGVYWSAQYQDYLVVRDGIAVRYQWSPAACYEGHAGLFPVAMSTNLPAGQHDWVVANEHTIALKRRSDGLLIDFNRVDHLPLSCTTPPVDTAEINLEVMRLTMQRFGHRLSPRVLTNLGATVEQLDTRYFDSPLATQLSLFEALSAALASSSDRHAFLLARELQQTFQTSFPEFEKPLVDQYESRLLQFFREQRLQSFCNEAVWLGYLTVPRSANEIDLPHDERKHFYLAIMKLHNLTLDSPYHPDNSACMAEALRSMAKELQQSRDSSSGQPTLTVDLRLNEGGSLLASQVAQSLYPLAEPFARVGDHTVAMSREPYLVGYYVDPQVLISSVTASAAEHLAHGLRLRGFSLRGAATRGAYSPTLVRTLPNGWILGLSMYPHERVRDGYDKPYPDGQGIQPDCMENPWTIPTVNPWPNCH